MTAKKIQRLESPPPDPDYFWRAIPPEEYKILVDQPEKYGRTSADLKELGKAVRLRDEQCVQVSQSEREARGWLRDGGTLIRIPRSKLDDADWEQVTEHHFIFVTGAAVVSFYEIIDE